MGFFCWHVSRSFFTRSHGCLWQQKQVQCFNKPSFLHLILEGYHQSQRLASGSTRSRYGRNCARQSALYPVGVSRCPTIWNDDPNEDTRPHTGLQSDLACEGRSSHCGVSNSMGSNNHFAGPAPQATTCNRLAPHANANQQSVGINMYQVVSGSSDYVKDFKGGLDYASNLDTYGQEIFPCSSDHNAGDSYYSASPTNSSESRRKPKAQGSFSDTKQAPSDSDNSSPSSHRDCLNNDVGSQNLYTSPSNLQIYGEPMYHLHL